jgi:nitroreductase
MNSIIQSLTERKSVRAFTDQEIPEEIVPEILMASTQAPTAGNLQLYTILRIRDAEKKHRLSISCDNQPFIERAKLILIFCADILKWYNAYMRRRPLPSVGGRVRQDVTPVNPGKVI